MFVPEGAAVEAVRATMHAPPLRRSEKRKPGADPKWKVGDILLPLPPDDRDAVAEAAGLDSSAARTYWKTAEAWPPPLRRACSWTVHRQLAAKTDLWDPSDRFTAIHDGMTTRQAAVLTTGRELDRKPIHRVDDDEVVLDLAKMIMGPRHSQILPKLHAAIEGLMDGRQTAKGKRTSATLRRLDTETRKVQKAIRLEHRTRFHGHPVQGGSAQAGADRVRYRARGSAVGECRRLTVDEDSSMVEELVTLRDAAHQAAVRIRAVVGATDTEGWEEPEWVTLELSGPGNDDDIDDAEIVYEPEETSVIPG